MSWRPYDSKPKSQPANASRLQNQHAKDNKSQTANKALNCVQCNHFLYLLLDFL